MSGINPFGTGRMIWPVLPVLYIQDMKSLLTGILMSLVLSVAAQRSGKPNIIYIYADDLGYGELGCYGQQKIKTPNLDKLAAEGMRFADHYTGAPVCAPARCILMTGRHSGHAYIRGNYELGGFEDDKEGGQMPLPEGTYTIAHMLKKAGYVTGAVGKWGLGVANTTGHPNLQGFDYFYGYLDQKQAHNYYPTHLWENMHWDTLRNDPIKVHQPLDPGVTDPAAFNRYKGREYALDKMAEKARAFIQRNKDRAFFLYLPFPAPHLSLQVPDEALEQYKGKFDDKPYWGQNNYTPNLYPRASYAAMISYLDKHIGLIMEQLKQLGLDRNTIVMFSSDNGTTFKVGGVDAEYFNSTGGLRGRKQDLWEGGIREPFIVRWPGKVAAGKVSGHISAQYDLMATLAELTGSDAGSTDGVSFLSTILGKSGQAKHKYLYFEFPEKLGQVAIRMGRWKGVKSNMRKDPSSPWEIFDLESDRAETSDLSASHPELVKQFDEILKKEHRPSHIREWEFISPKFSTEK